VEIGRLTAADLPALAGLYKQFWGEESCLEKMRATFRRLRDRPGYILLAAKNDGRLVGSFLQSRTICVGGASSPFVAQSLGTSGMRSMA